MYTLSERFLNPLVFLFSYLLEPLTPLSVNLGMIRSAGTDPGELGFRLGLSSKLISLDMHFFRGYCESKLPYGYNSD